MDAGDSAFFAWEVGLGAARPHHRSREPAPREHLSSPALHPRHGRARPGDDAPGPAPLALHPRRGLHLQPPSPADLRPVRPHRLLAGPRASDCGEGAALFAGAAFAFSPIRTDQIAHLSTLGTQWLPRARPLHAPLRARPGAPEMRSWPRSSSCSSSWPAGITASSASRSCPWAPWCSSGVAFASACPAADPGHRPRRPRPLASLPHAPRGPRARALLAGKRRDGLLLRGRRVVPGHELVEPGLGRGHRALSHHRAQQPLSRSRGSRPRDRRRSSCSGDAGSVRAATPWPSWPSAVAAVVVALGPEVRAFGRVLVPSPFGLLREVVPVFQMIRVTSRAGVYLALPLAVLAAKGLGALRPASARRWASSTLVALAETLIVPIPMPEWTKIIDTRREPPAVYRWLADQPGRTPVVHLPMLDVCGLERRPRYHESIYMVYSTLHWKPLVNGYAGIEPARYVKLRELARALPVARVPGRPPRDRRPLRRPAPWGLRAPAVAAHREPPSRLPGRPRAGRFPR